MEHVLCDTQICKVIFSRSVHCNQNSGAHNLAGNNNAVIISHKNTTQPKKFNLHKLLAVRELSVKSVQQLLSTPLVLIV